jgi:hypothetical protein
MSISTLTLNLLSQWAPRMWFSGKSQLSCPAPMVRSASAQTTGLRSYGPNTDGTALRCPRKVATAAIRPLRVVHVVEIGQPRSQAGRMVISGRMADVCAELDRLAASELS